MKFALATLLLIGLAIATPHAKAGKNNLKATIYRDEGAIPPKVKNGQKTQEACSDECWNSLDNALDNCSVIFSSYDPFSSLFTVFRNLKTT